MLKRFPLSFLQTALRKGFFFPLHSGAKNFDWYYLRFISCFSVSVPAILQIATVTPVSYGRAVKSTKIIATIIFHSCFCVVVFYCCLPEINVLFLKFFFKSSPAALICVYSAQAPLSKTLQTPLSLRSATDPDL